MTDIPKTRTYVKNFLILSIFALSLFPISTFSATLLSDSFTGTTIDTAKWTINDNAGTNITQNGVLTITNSYSAAVWGNTALYSDLSFARSGLNISAVMTAGSAQLLGYGDYNFQSPGTAAYIIDISGANNGATVYALIWNNASLAASNLSCGTATNGATYTLKVTATGMEVYKNTGSGDVLQCSVNGNASMTNKPVFMESEGAASTFDDLLVTDGLVEDTVPGAPTSLTTTRGDTEVDLSWTAPVSDGGDTITDYLVEYKQASSGTWLSFTDGVSITTEATVTGLTNNTAYNFRVSAVNGIGTSTPSSVATSTPSAPSAPNAPTSVTAVGGNAQAIVSFTAPADNGGSAITSYTVTSSPGNITASGASSPITVTGLTNLTSYTFTVTATNAIGTSSASLASNSVTPQDITVIFSDSFTGTTIDTNKWVEVDSVAGGSGGDIQQNGSLTAANSYVGGNWGSRALYSVETFSADSLEISAVMTRASDQLLGYGDYDFDQSGAKAYMIDLTTSVLALAWNNNVYDSPTSCGTVTDGATYTLKVITGGFEVYKNDVLACTHTTSIEVDDKPIFLQSSASASTYDDVSVIGLSVPDTAPDAPTSVTAAGGNSQAVVSFTAPADNGGSAITSYTVTSSPGNITASGASSPITVTGLTNGVEYTFTVTATNAIGTSSASSVSNAITPAMPDLPDQVTGLSAHGTNKRVLLEWDIPDSGGAAITDYVVEYKISSSSTWATFSETASTTAKTIVTGLTNDVQYDFRVSAENSGGVGPVSATATATPLSIGTLAFVITGESNSGGIGLNSEATSGELASRSAVQIMNLTSGDFLFENLDIGTNNLRDHSGLEAYYDSSHGFELQLANSTEGNAFPDQPQVYLTKTGHGGSQISQWNIGGAYWTKFLQRTAAAKTQLPEDRQWVVWLSLGINDAIAGVATSTWKTAMVAHINKIKADLPGSIIIMTEFQAMSSGSGYPTYNAVMDEIAAEEADVFAINTTGAALRDGNHWSYAGLKTVTTGLVSVTKNVLGLVYPGTPTSLQATPGGTQAVLQWVAPISNGGASITDYLVEYKQSTVSTWTTFSDGVSTATSSTVTGLSGGTTYNFRVSAVNSNGSGEVATVTATTTDASGPAISDILATTGTTTATISWSTDEDASSQVEYGLTVAYSTSTVETDTSPRVTEHEVTLSNLAACTAYHYKIVSEDASSNSTDSSDNTFETIGCVGSAEIVNQTAETVTATSGGTVELGSGSSGIELNIAAGATDSDVTYNISQLDPDDVVAAIGAPGAFSPVGSYMYDLKAYEDLNTLVTTFDEPITLTISYGDSDVRGFDESSLMLYTHNGTSWSALTDCAVNTTENEITCSTTHFSLFALFGTESSDSTTSRSKSSKRTYGCKDPLANNYSEFVSHKPELCRYNTSTSTSSASFGFTRNLELGMSGEDVRQLQKFLNSQGFTVTVTGAGSLGNETTLFGPATKAALTKFQVSKGISPAAGYFGPVTRMYVSVPVSVENNTAPILDTTSVIVFTRTLEQGSEGEDVKMLQKILGVDQVGYFGPATLKAVQDFQVAQDITKPGSTGYGVVGPMTRTKLNAFVK
jgi:trimeric autotransporter adhesin